jgi:hypothetical protein
VLDGLHQRELLARIECDDGSLPNLRRLAARGAIYRDGAVSSYPSSAWPAHNTIGSSAWCGHHGFINASFFRRAQREVVDLQGQRFETERGLDHDVDTLYEAVHIRHGQWTGRPGGRGALTAAINTPCTRGAMHASLERRLVGNPQKLKALTAELTADISSRWLADGQAALQREAEIDAHGTAQALLLFSDPEIPPPTLTFHALGLTACAGHAYGPHSDGAGEALEESDRRIGRVLAALDARDLFDETLFVVTGGGDTSAQDPADPSQPAKWLVEHAVRGVACDSFVYLRDLDVKLAFESHKTVVTVRENDPNDTGKRLPVCQAEVEFIDPGRYVARVQTGHDGQAIFTPINVTIGTVRRSAATIDGEHTTAVDFRSFTEVEVRAEGFNTRQFRRNGGEILPDIRAALYGDGGGV